MIMLVWFAVIASFLITFIGLKFWIRKCKQIGLLWEDMNKFGKPKNVAGSGGIIVAIGFTIGVLIYIALRTLLKTQSEIEVQIFALLSTILLLAIIGLVDDFLGWHHGGLSARVRLVLALMASIPLVVINVGTSSVSLPFVGMVELGVLYPLICIPIGIAATSTVFNFLAGYNGLEAGLGILSIGFLSYVAYVNNSAWLGLIGLCMVAALIGYWFYSKNPAKTFPGDVLTYSVGGLIGAMAIIGNFEKIAFIVFMPFIIEMILKLRGGMKPPRKQNFGIPQKDGSLKLPYEKVYSLTHFAIWTLSKFKKRVYENDVVYFVFIIQIIFILIGFAML